MKPLHPDHNPNSLKSFLIGLTLFLLGYFSWQYLLAPTPSPTSKTEATPAQSTQNDAARDAPNSKSHEQTDNAVVQPASQPNAGNSTQPDQLP